jgi:DNA-binding ferritin-like protein
MTAPKLTGEELVRLQVSAEYLVTSAHTAHWMIGVSDHKYAYLNEKVMGHYAKMKAIVDAAELRQAGEK